MSVIQQKALTEASKKMLAGRFNDSKKKVVKLPISPNNNTVKEERSKKQVALDQFPE